MNDDTVSVLQTTGLFAILVSQTLTFPSLPPLTYLENKINVSKTSVSVEHFNISFS